MKKKTKRLGSLAVAFAMTTTTVLAAVPAPAEAAGEFTGTLASADSAKADGNVVNVSFNGGEVTGRITFLEDGIFRYNVDPTGEFGEYAVRLFRRWDLESRMSRYFRTSWSVKFFLFRRST